MVWYNPFTWFQTDRGKQRSPAVKVNLTGIALVQSKLKTYPIRGQKIIEIYCQAVRHILKVNRRVETEYQFVIPFFDLHGFSYNDKKNEYSLRRNWYSLSIIKDYGYVFSETFASELCNLLNESGAEERQACVITMRDNFNEAKGKWLEKMEEDNVKIRGNNYINHQLPPKVEILLNRLAAAIK